MDMDKDMGMDIDTDTDTDMNKDTLNMVIQRLGYRPKSDIMSESAVFIC
jgi:hypothetical protein